MDIPPLLKLLITLITKTTFYERLLVKLTIVELSLSLTRKSFCMQYANKKITNKGTRAITQKRYYTMIRFYFLCGILGGY